MKQRMQKMESFAYPVTITRKRGLRAIYLRISRTGKVLVSAPSAMALGEVEHFVASKDGWIREKLARMPAIPCYTYDSGEKHFFLGREYPHCLWPRHRELRVCGGGKALPYDRA